MELVDEARQTSGVSSLPLYGTGLF
jgi:hypothetical protein